MEKNTPRIEKHWDYHFQRTIRTRYASTSKIPHLASFSKSDRLNAQEKSPLLLLVRKSFMPGLVRPSRIWVRNKERASQHLTNTFPVHLLHAIELSLCHLTPPFSTMPRGKPFDHIRKEGFPSFPNGKWIVFENNFPQALSGDFSWAWGGLFCEMRVFQARCISSPYCSLIMLKNSIDSFLIANCFPPKIWSILAV
jgi:hypothetical protein